MSAAAETKYVRVPEEGHYRMTQVAFSVLRDRLRVFDKLTFGDVADAIQAALKASSSIQEVVGKLTDNSLHDALKASLESTAATPAAIVELPAEAPIITKASN